MLKCYQLASLKADEITSGKYLEEGLEEQNGKKRNEMFDLS